MKEELKRNYSTLPREKAKQGGVSVLTDAELLALILRTGRKDANVLELSEEILQLRGECKGLTALMHFSMEELQGVSGIGGTKAIELLAIGEMARRIWNSRVREDLKSFRSPQDVLLYFKEDLRYLGHEEVRVLYLDTKAKLLKDCLLAKGSGCSASVSGREVFREALMLAASCMILVHNHPSGDPTPSKEDEHFTESVRRAGEYIGLPLVDHIIIGDNCYYSFKEQGKF